MVITFFFGIYHQKSSKSIQEKQNMETKPATNCETSTYFVRVDGIEDIQRQLPLLSVEEISTVFYQHFDISTTILCIDIEPAKMYQPVNRYAIVELGTVIEAEKAVEALDGITLESKHKLSVSSFNKVRSSVPTNEVLIQKKKNMRNFYSSGTSNVGGGFPDKNKPTGEGKQTMSVCVRGVSIVQRGASRGRSCRHEGTLYGQYGQRGMTSGHERGQWKPFNGQRTGRGGSSWRSKPAGEWGQREQGRGRRGRLESWTMKTPEWEREEAPTRRQEAAPRGRGWAARGRGETARRHGASWGQEEDIRGQEGAAAWKMKEASSEDLGASWGQEGWEHVASDDDADEYNSCSSGDLTYRDFEDEIVPESSDDESPVGQPIEGADDELVVDSADESFHSIENDGDQTLRAVGMGDERKEDCYEDEMPLF